VGAGARRAAPRPVLQPAGPQPGAAFQPAGFQALCQLKPGEESAPNANRLQILIWKLQAFEPMRWSLVSLQDDMITDKIAGDCS
jgi:hypothetical protein